jgi:hypothetical protein
MSVKYFRQRKNVGGVGQMVNSNDYWVGPWNW